MHIPNLEGTTPREFEELVVEWFQGRAGQVERLAVRHQERLVGRYDQSYVIDGTARMRIAGLDFLVVIECKHQGRRVERKVVAELHARMQAVNAQKAALFSTGGFQRGAVELAEGHQIATIEVTESGMHYRTRGFVGQPRLQGAPRHITWLVETRGADALSMVVLGVSGGQEHEDRLAARLHQSGK